MFEYGDEVQLTEDSCSYYKTARPSLWDVCGAVLTVTEVTKDYDGDFLYHVEDDSGECFRFYEFELEFA